MIPGRRPVRLLVLFAMAVGVGSLIWALSSPRRGYAPRQPIYFRHSRMASEPRWVRTDQGDSTNVGGYNIPCLYCHTMPYKGRHSTVPATDICMNCHSVVGQDKEWVLVLKGYFERGEPIPWVKVHDLPDFVYYDHSAHLNAVDAQGKPKLDCVNCHLDVENQQTVAVRTPLNMAWCLGCHKKPEMTAPIDCDVCHR